MKNKTIPHVIEKVLSNFGYFKTARIVERIAGSSNFKNYTKPPTHQNYEEFLQKYSLCLWVYICVAKIAQAAASLPMKVYNNKEEEIKDHPFLKLIAKPNSFMTQYDMNEYIFSCNELTGNSYFLQDKANGQGQPTILFPLLSHMVAIDEGTGIAPDGSPQLIKQYIYRTGAAEKKYTPEEVVHWRYFNPLSLRYGLSATAAASQNTDILRDMMTDAQNIFRNGAQLDGVLETDLKIPQEKKDEILINWYKKYGGVTNTRQVGIADYGLKFKPTRSTPAELEYTGGRKMTREEICSAFQVPPAVVGLFEYSNYANTDAQILIFWRDTICPKLIKVQQSYQKILDKFDTTLTCRFDTGGVKALQADEDKKSQIAQRYFSMGVPFNEIIKKLKLPFDEIEGGDIGYLPFNLMPSNVSRETIPDEEGKEPVEEPKSALTIAGKQRKWEIKIKETDKIENQMKPDIGKVFDELKSQVYSRLGEYRSTDIMEGKELKLAHKFTKQPLHEGVAMFDYSGIRNIYKEALEKHKRRAIEAAAKREAEFLALENFSFNMTRGTVIHFIEKYGLEKATAWVDGMRGEIKDILQIGINEGYSIPEIRNLLQEKIFDETVEKYRIDRISRTEISEASNFGTLETYKQSGVVEKKEWLTAFDERTCDTCADMNGQVAELGENFKSEEGEIEYPPLHPQCRCDIIPVVKE